MTPHGEDEADVDGHYWHSCEYVAAWIQRHETDASPTLRARQESELERICAALATDQEAPLRILELGVGSGRLTHRLLETYPNAHVIGLDFSLPMLERAWSRLESYSARVVLVTGALEESGVIAPLGGNFDAVVSRATLHHLATDRLRSLYTEIHAALSAGGRLVNVDKVNPAEAEGAGGYSATLSEHLRFMQQAGLTTAYEQQERRVVIIGAKAHTC